MKYDQIWAGLTEQPWAILPAMMEQILEIVAARREGLTAEQIEARVQARLGEGFTLSEPTQLGNVRVIPLQGVIAQKIPMFQKMSGGTSTEQVGGWLADALADDSVRTIVFDVDSPGGSVAGLEELAAQIFASRDLKPSIAVANTLMASAAYYLAAQASEVVGSPSAMVGSIGTIVMHAESSQAQARFGVKYSVIAAGKHKADANSVEPLTDQGRASLQQLTDDYYSQFVAAVARGRATTDQAVRDGYGQGKLLIAQAAQAAGLIDRVASLQDVLAGLAAPTSAPPAARQSTRQDTSIPPAAAAAPETPQGAPTMPADAKPADSAPVVPPAQLPPSPTPEQLRSVGAAAERERIAAIQSAAQILGLDATFAAAAVQSGASLQDFQASAIAEVAKKNVPAHLPPAGDVRGAGSERDNFAAAAEQALLIRSGNRAVISGELAPGAQDLARLHSISLAEESLVRCGFDRRQINGMSREMIAKTALAMPTSYDVASAGIAAAVGFHTTGSFPSLALNASHKSLARGFQEAEVSFRIWTNQGPSMPDFKVGNITKFGEASDLQVTPEGDESQETSLSDDREVIMLDRYTGLLSITFQMLLADDLQALNLVPQRLGAAAARTLNRLVYSLLTSNPTMRDGYALFDDTNHQGNDRTSGAAPTVAELGALQSILRKMSGLNSDSKLNQSLRYLLVPTALETAAAQLLMSMADPAANVNSEVKNPWFGKVTPVADAELDDYSAVKYFGAANPMETETIQYRYLQGQETPVQTSWYDPRRATRYVQVEQSFGAAVAEYRGLVRDAGQ